MVGRELILYSKKTKLVGKGNSVSFYKRIFIFSIHFLLRKMSLILRKKRETNKTELKDQGH